jgi:predicted aconitase
MPPLRTLRVTMDELADVRRTLNHAQPGDALAAVSLGTPHFSVDEFERLAQLFAHYPGALRCGFYVNTSRFILWQLEASGLAQQLAARGVQIVTDTCTYITPIIKETRGVVMTNSGKWAHYAPANIGVTVAYGSMQECVRSAFEGSVCFDE